MTAPSHPARPVVLSIITRWARGGSERRLLDVLGAVDAEHLVVVGGDSAPGAVAELSERVEVVRLAPLVRDVDPRRDAAALTELVRTLRTGRVDVVHTHQSKAGLLGRLATVAAPGPLVYHSASMASFGPGYGRVPGSAFALAERATATLVDRYFVVGHDLRRRLVANGVPAERATVVRTGLDLRAFRPPSPDDQRRARARFGLDPEAPVVAVVGSLDERKGVGRLPALLRSATGGAGTGGGPASVGVLVAGDGPGRESLRSGLAAVPGVTARLLGHVDEVDRVMAAADVLVLASSAEGLPQVVVQAAASGLPVVAYDVDGVREVAALGAAIGIAPLGDEAALAAALGGALAVAGRRRRRTVAESALAEWDPAAVASRYRRTYAEDLADRGRR